MREVRVVEDVAVAVAQVLPTGPGPVALLVDPVVAAGDLVSGVTGHLRERGVDVRRQEVRRTADLDSVAILGSALSECVATVAVGGGTVIDAAKLALLAARAEGGATAAPTRWLDAHDGSGMLLVTEDACSGAAGELLAVPTTVGTGSERSANAVMDTPVGRLLVSAPQLRPACALLQPTALATLPAQVLLAGCFEILCRTVGPYVAGAGGGARQDQLVEAVAGRIVALAEQLRLPEAGSALGAAEGDADGSAVQAHRGRQLVELVRLGGLSHTEQLHGGRDRFGYKAWFLANELSWLAGVTKTSALASVMPAVMSVVAEGRTAWGDAERLQRVWAPVAVAADLPGASAAEGMSELVDRWSVPRASTVDSDRLVAQVLRRWGPPLPYLGAVSGRDVHEVALRASQLRPAG